MEGCRMGFRQRLGDAASGLRYGWNLNNVKIKATAEQIHAQRFGATPGVEMSPEKYGEYFQTSSPVFRAIHLRSDAVSSAPMQVVTVDSDGLATPVERTDPAQLLFDRPNRWWTSADLLYHTEASLSTWGKAFWFIDRIQATGVVTIWPLPTTRVQVIPGKNGEYIKGFQMTTESGERVSFLPEEIIWFRRVRPDNEFAAASPIAPGRAAFDSTINANLYNRNFFINGAIPNDVVWYMNNAVDDDDYDDFEKRLFSRHGGTGNAHRPMIWDLSEGAKPERLGITQKDMEFISSLQWGVEEAARVFGIMPPMLMDRSSTTLDNVQQARLEFYTGTVSSEWSFISREITAALSDVLGLPENYAVQFDTTKVRSMIEAEAELRKTRLEEVKAGTLTINEYRAEFGMEGVNWGDVAWLPMALTPVQDGEKAEPLALPPAPPPTDDTDDATEDEDDDAELIDVDAAWDNVTRALSTDRPRHKRKPSKAAWDARKVENYWKATDAEIKRGARDFRAMQQQLFRQQLRAVLRALVDVEIIESAWTKDLSDSIFNPTTWIPVFEKRGRPLLFAAFSRAGRNTADEFNLPPFDPNTVSGRAFIDQRTELWARSVNQETAQLIASEMSAGVANNETIVQLEQRVEKTFKFNNAVRAERIARTESGAAASAGHQELFDQMEVVDRKQWITTLDDRTRPDHVAAHEQVRPKSAPFSVNGEELMAPRLGNVAGNNINCRCGIVPLIIDQEPVVVPLAVEA